MALAVKRLLGDVVELLGVTQAIEVRLHRGGEGQVQAVAAQVEFESANF
jgi:hypothetical protein